MTDQWVEEGGALKRRFVFKDFVEALEFVNAVARVAEELQHHPDIAIQNYKEVFVSTMTHDAGNTVTEKDRNLAKQVDTLAP